MYAIRDEAKEGTSVRGNSPFKCRKVNAKGLLLIAVPGESKGTKVCVRARPRVRLFGDSKGKAMCPSTFS